VTDILINSWTKGVLESVGVEPDYDAERKLPSGKTCADCQHGKICNRLFGAVRHGFTSCDFWPSRFSPLSDSLTNGGSSK
jgi:hypothetical protein